MEIKLTLKLKKRTIERGKAFTKKCKASLSGLIENYLDKITVEKKQIEVIPLVKSLSGVIISQAVKKNDYADSLREKYKYK